MTELQEIEDEMMNHPDPVVSVPELADALDASDTHVRNQLRLLKRAEAVESKDVGARATAWWHTERVTPPHVPPEDHPDQRPLDDVPAADAGESDETGAPWGTVELPDLPGQGRREEQRQEALRAILRTIYEPDEDAENVYKSSYETHETGYASAKSWRKNAAGPALKELAERGVVELVDPNAGVWAWAGGSDD
jgi:transcription initiation factor IIE alpha subunit